MASGMSLATHVITYADANDQGEHGLDLVHQTREWDGDRIVYGEESGWQWLVSEDGEGFDPDTLLDAHGWKRTTGWTYEGELAGSDAWTASVERRDTE